MIERKLMPGSQCLYLKIYTGLKTADVILEEAIQPLVQSFLDKGKILKWFFIRYNDPKPHLRIRLMLKENFYYSEALEKINSILKPYMKSGEISNVVMDTYVRELERYGENTIEDAETLFWLSSQYALYSLFFDDDEKIMITLFYIDGILNELHLTDQEKLEWVKSSNESFKYEFHADKKLNSQLDKKYREFKPQFLEFIKAEGFSEARELILSNIQESRILFQNILSHDKNGSLGMPLSVFFQSIFHMNINRLFVSNQRLFEMVIYDYLVRYYKTLVYRSRLEM
ncbi:thiopeptide-type bacteriocin biosynthesis protein [Chryseobacterium sp.]|uniref:thiopeptide-type bacteriocin biosynthesis protein n=1 Tax=Chryseobacterium sp. TaxID=1871047 RepID=UPI0025BBA620|nr:thiopeptide-type bacteriocin biosynthesis protein [Chryseobacterium sp.]